MKTMILLFAAFFVIQAKAVGEDLVKDAEKATNAVLDAYRNSSEAAFDSRKKNTATILLSYSPLDLVLSSKLGANIAWHADADVLYELDYSYSSVKASIESVDLSKMSETRISLLKRKFNGGTFNWYWGAHYNALNAHFNSQWMGTAPNGTSDLLDVQTLGLSIGVGHRWVFKENFSFGIDWFSWAQPLVILTKKADFLDATTNSNYKDDVDTALKVIGYFPRWAAFKLYLGYSF